MKRRLLPTWAVLLLAMLVAALLCLMQAAASAAEGAVPTEAQRVYEHAAPAVVAVVLPPQPMPETRLFAPVPPGQPVPPGGLAVPEGAELKHTEEGVEIRVDPEKFKGDLPMVEDRPGPPPPGVRDARDLRELIERQARAVEMAPRQPGPTLSAGFLIDGDGHILTVVPGDAHLEQVRVQWLDGVQEQCRVVGRDPATGLCLLKSERANRPAPLAWGDAGALRVGSTLYSIAHPEGFRNSLDVGLVAGLDRNPQRPEAREAGGMIQTTLAVRPGTAGAPLLDADGKVVGVRTVAATSPMPMPEPIARVVGPGADRANFIVARRDLLNPFGGPAAGIDLAIPAPQARDLAEQMRLHGKVKRGWLGVQISDVSPEKRAALNLPADLPGVLIIRVFEASQADAGGLREGDVVLAIDGQPVASTGEMIRAVQRHRPADRITISVWREGDRRDVVVILGDQPEQL